MLQQPRSREETPCTRTQEVSWETLLNKGRKPIQILCYILQDKYLHYQERPSTQEVSQTLEDYHPREVHTFSQVNVLAEISKLARKI
jgi:hypothetical protein